MINQLLPKKNQFYDLFNQAAALSVEASKVLLQLVENHKDVNQLALQLKEIEHQCDAVAGQTMELLNHTFITPLDREDIHELILKLDDVVDLITAAGTRFVFFKVGEPTPHAVSMAKQLVHGCEKMSAAVAGLRSHQKFRQVHLDCMAVHEVENHGDDILHEALTDLFAHTTDAIRVIKWKEIYETMERVTDRLEDVANVIQGVIGKMS